MSSSTDFPSELLSSTKEFQSSLGNVERVLRPLLATPLSQLHETKNMSALDKAKLDCLSAFALNSLVWMWLRTKGENPKESEVKQELDRVKAAMVQVKTIQDREKRNRVDTEAAKRFVESGIWNPGETKLKRSAQDSSVANSPNVGINKRKKF